MKFSANKKAWQQGVCADRWRNLADQQKAVWGRPKMTVPVRLPVV